MKINLLRCLLLLLLCSTASSLYAQKKFVYASNGVLYFPNGEELALWGVNLQPNLSWEYNSRLRPIGIPLEINTLKKLVDENLDEIEKIGANIVRCHLTPADFTDTEGNIVETIFLDVLDYMIAQASKRNICVYIAFINHMNNSYVEQNMWKSLHFEEWIYNKDVVQKSANYIAQLLNRVNPYTKCAYKLEPIIALWEVINEPRYYSYKAIKQSIYYNDFVTWATSEKKEDNEVNYMIYRKMLVISYINNMYDVIRSTGAQQPIVWNCNWHRMMVDHRDVFDAVSESKVEVVSFCNYPGQDLCPEKYWDNPLDLTQTNYSEFLKNGYNIEDWYGWARTVPFMGKAKVVYEFETFFNQSAYLYASMAQMFRSLGVQVAAMWTYCLSAYAPYHAGSHFLSLTCTPSKAAAFAVAGEIFKSIPLYTPYTVADPSEQANDQFAISRNRNLCIFSSGDKLLYSGDLKQENKLLFSQQPKEIVGIANSPFVYYNGSGLYNVKVENKSLKLTIQPNAKWINEPWGKTQGRKVVTELDYNTPNKISILLKGWERGNFTIYKFTNGEKKAINKVKSLKNILLTPGKYSIEKR